MCYVSIFLFLQATKLRRHFNVFLETSTATRSQAAVKRLTVFLTMGSVCMFLCAMASLLVTVSYFVGRINFGIPGLFALLIIYIYSRIGISFAQIKSIRPKDEMPSCPSKPECCARGTAVHVDHTSNYSSARENDEGGGDINESDINENNESDINESDFDEGSAGMSTGPMRNGGSSFFSSWRSRRHKPESNGNAASFASGEGSIFGTDGSRSVVESSIDYGARSSIDPYDIREFDP